jgi:DNA-binding GntR family transcriptional regulator
VTALTDRTEPVSLVDQVVDFVRTRILSGEYEPGARLRLQPLAEESGASLIPVREALRILEAERLVETIPNRGARVANISREDMEDLYRVRILLETQAIAESPPLTEEESAEFGALLDRLKDAVEAGDDDLALRLHRQYHFGLYNRTQSKWLITLIELLWKHTERYQRLSLPIRHDSADPEHRGVLGPLSHGDPTKAAEALRAHLETTARLVADAYPTEEEGEKEAEEEAS